MNVQLAVPPGARVKVRPRFRSAFKFTPPTPVALPVAPCGLPS